LSKRKNIALWIITGVLALMFLFAGGLKLVGAQQAVDNFHRWGYPDWFRLVTGGLEVLCAALLLVPRATVFAGALLLCTMVGAMGTHIHSHELAMLPLPLILAILLGVVIVGRREGARVLPRAAAFDGNHA
jgi:putative oxidoreductase